MRRYVFSEFIPADKLIRPATLRPLAERAIQLYVALTPDLRPRAVDILRACREHGVAVGIWPMIDDQRGRWASAWTGVAYADYVRSLLDELDSADATPDELFVDLEPPIALTKLILQGKPTFEGPPPRVGAKALRELVAEVADTDLDVTAAVHPLAICGAGWRGWQRTMGTPIEGLAFSRIFTMAYTSLVEGYGRKLFRRRDAEAALARWTAQTRERLGERAGVAIGVIGVGALGDEQCYREPLELSRDVAIARAAGAEHIALFNLGGALDRPPASTWLDALVADSEPITPAQTLRVHAATRALSGAGLVLDRLAHRRERGR